MKKITSLIVTLLLLFSFSPNLALAVDVPTRERFYLPSEAREIYRGVYNLGSAKDPITQQMVDGLAIVHYKEAPAIRPGSIRPRTVNCFGYLAAGAKWKTVENWLVDSANTRGLDGVGILSTVNNAISKWEDATNGTLGNGGVNVMGNGSTASGLAVDKTSPDGQNEVVFGEIADSNAIAVTVVWGYFSGPTSRRQLIEWDQIYDDVKYDWSLSGQSGKMDFDNIATHEIGHAFGMADLYNSSCADETMYGYATEGETKKRDLGSGDIKGINDLY